MSVRMSLLAILDQGACYGNQLRAEFERRTGAAWPLNVGQIYNTLERLERDGLVLKDQTAGRDHVYYVITEAGRSAVAAWVRDPAPHDGPQRDELALKLALASTLPGVDAVAMVARQRRETAEALDVARSDEFADFAAEVMADARISALEAELAWLDRVDERLSARPPQERQRELSTDLPRRGRPQKSAPQD